MNNGLLRFCARLGALLTLVFCISLTACGDSNNGSNDAGMTADGGGGTDSEPDCFNNPTTHHEIINACSTSDKVDKTPVLPLLNADGTLPPIP